MYNKIPAYPLITIDPYFSYWSFTDVLNKSDTRHWTGKRTPITGDIIIGDVSYRFLGKGENTIPQVKRDVTPLKTTYFFENEFGRLCVSFWSPAILQKVELFSRPCSYIDYEFEPFDNKNHKIEVCFSFDETFVYDQKKDSKIFGDTLKHEQVSLGYMSKRKQPLLETSGDDLTINWGYLLLSGAKELSNVTFVQGSKKAALVISTDISKQKKSFVVVSYDDVIAFNYFGDLLPGYWRKKHASIIDAITCAHKEHDSLLVLVNQKDTELLEAADKSGGLELQKIITASYRQSIAAHKACEDPNGNLLFISKENFSNGCAATVDVTYPSVPLFLLENPELVLGMIRPILKNAKMPFWIFDFAPHDAGRYPHVTGNVYGMADQFSNGPRKDLCIVHNKETYPPYHFYSNDPSIFDINRQMPVEECGNMLIVVYLAAKLLDNKTIIKENYDNFEKWVQYLVKHGKNPGNQLCTDDFAGHLAANANLALKAIYGIESFALINKFCGQQETYEKYHAIAKEYALSWAETASVGSHTALTLDSKNGWSLKYNMLWDRLLGTNFFTKELYENELDLYISKSNKFGIPLDSRKDYTKSDWLVWVSALTDDIKKRELIYKGIVAFLEKTKDRVPFADWYDTVTGKKMMFQARSVQAGCFASILVDKLRTKFN